MFYNPKDESILRNGDVAINFSEIAKGRLVEALLASIKGATTEQGKYLRYQNTEVNVIEEAFSRAPMMCNALASRGYKNVLFVGHYNDHQTHWMLDKFASRMVNVLPPSREGMQTFPDLNIIAQFVPVLWRAMRFGWEDVSQPMSFSVVRPPESKHKGTMHKIYDWMDVSSRALSCSSQYKHGISSWSLDADNEEKFDAVVFLGVPMEDPEVGFEEDQVREMFAPYCTPSFEMVDVYYGANYQNKWQNGNQKDFTPNIETAFTVRSSWDDGLSGEAEEFDIMDRMFSVY